MFLIICNNSLMHTLFKKCNHPCKFKFKPNTNWPFVLCVCVIIKTIQCFNSICSYWNYSPDLFRNSPMQLTHFIFRFSNIKKNLALISTEYFDHFHTKINLFTFTPWNASRDRKQKKQQTVKWKNEMPHSNRIYEHI